MRAKFQIARVIAEKQPLKRRLWCPFTTLCGLGQSAVEASNLCDCQLATKMSVIDREADKNPSFIGIVVLVA